MSQPPPLLDPFELLKGLAAPLEKGLERLADRGVRTTLFTRLLHQALAASLVTRRVSSALQDAAFRALNLPSRTDVLRLGERLQALDDRVIALAADQTLRGRVSPGTRGARGRQPALPRTRKPPQAKPLAQVPAERTAAGAAARRTRRAGP